MNTPIYSAIKAYADSCPLPFHMPGHKLGAGIPEQFLQEIEKLDLTEIPGTDNLHSPTGAIREAQELAATAFGARKSFFLVNGSTVGLHAAIAALCKPGQRLIVGRDCHKAAINGMLLAGAIPFYIFPEYSERFGINTGITPAAVERALENAPDAAGVLITRPNYYGICSDVKAIADVVHKRGKLLIVDEAHGSHLAFSSRLPFCALKKGADICIQSAHKTLPAFTQGAYLHVGSEYVDIEKLQYFLDIFQTTSPSYIIMAFLDIARAIMQNYGESLLNGLLDSIEACGAKMAASGIGLLSEKDIPGFLHDTTRITANTSKIGLSGYRAEKFLRDQMNIQVEMSDLSNIVCIATVADTPKAIERLFEGLLRLAACSCEGRGCGSGSEQMYELPGFCGLQRLEQVLTPAEILHAATQKVLLRDAVGKISGEIISPYPPGIALVCPGEIITEEMVDFLLRIRQCGGNVDGIDENQKIVVI